MLGNIYTVEKVRPETAPSLVFRHLRLNQEMEFCIPKISTFNMNPEIASLLHYNYKAIPLLQMVMVTISILEYIHDYF